MPNVRGVPGDATGILVIPLDRGVNIICAAAPLWSAGCTIGPYNGLAGRVLSMTNDRRFEILGSAGRLINSSLDRGSVLERVIDSIIEATGAERGFVMLSSEGFDDLEMRVARNVDGRLLEGSSLQISQNIVKQVQQSSEAVVINDAMNDPSFESFQSVVELELRSILCVPLVARDRVIGAVYLDNRIRRGLFDKSDMDLAMAIAEIGRAHV